MEFESVRFQSEKESKKSFVLSPEYRQSVENGEMVDISEHDYFDNQKGKSRKPIDRKRRKTFRG
jgi:hypothetical protein